MAETFDPPVEIDLKANPGHIVFNTVEQARRWIDAEIAVWNDKFPDQATSLGHFYAQFLVDQKRGLQQVHREVTNAENAKSESVSPNDVRSTLEGFLNRKILHSESPIGKRAMDLIETADSQFKKQRAFGFLAAAITSDKLTFKAFQNSRFQGDNLIPFISGVALYQSFTGTGADSAKFVEQAVQSSFDGWQQQLATHQNDHFDAVQAIAQRRGQIDDEHTRQKGRFDEQLQNFKTDIDDLKTLYHEKLRSEAPAEYWRKKARNHAWTGRATITVFFALSAFFGYYAYDLASLLVDSIAAAIDAPAAEGAQSGAGGPSSFQLAFTRILVILVPGFFAVWLLRVLLKVALSNLAIADDARHRVTLVGMFRSLTEHGAKVSEADRILMLNALFRPNPGTTDDDTGPPNWFEVMMEQLKNRAR